jgi:hypothetical protein
VLAAATATQKRIKILTTSIVHTTHTATQDLHCILRHTHTHMLNPKIIFHVGTQEHIALHCHGMYGFVGGFLNVHT